VDLTVIPLYENAGERCSVFAQVGGSTWFFNPSDFIIDLSGFQNAIGPGQFQVVEIGNDLDIEYSPTPEPASLTLCSIGLLISLGGPAAWKRAAHRKKGRESLALGA
jgi:hypothetical protein